jgi:hypothetical protein
MSDFVVDGEYADPAWIAAAAKPAVKRTPLEVIAFANGPRPHPFSPNVHSVTIDDRLTHFADEAAYHAHMAEQDAPANHD